MRGIFAIWLALAVLTSACGSQQSPAAAGSAGDTSASAVDRGASVPSADGGSSVPAVITRALVMLSPLAPGAAEPAGSGTFHSTS
jgi:hypothetical protein